jgi:hypothetical protein
MGGQLWTTNRTVLLMRLPPPCDQYLVSLYHANDVVRFRVHGKSRFPIHQFPSEVSDAVKKINKDMEFAKVEEYESCGLKSFRIDYHARLIALTPEFFESVVTTITDRMKEFDESLG